MNYLHDVFIIKFDAWVVLGSLPRASSHALRGAVDRLEPPRKSVIPVAVLVLLDRRRRAALDLRAVPRDPSSSRGRRWYCWCIFRISILHPVNGRQPMPAD